jgi:hypothetical protein
MLVLVIFGEEQPSFNSSGRCWTPFVPYRYGESTKDFPGGCRCDKNARNTLPLDRLALHNARQG